MRQPSLMARPATENSNIPVVSRTTLAARFRGLPIEFLCSTRRETGPYRLTDRNTDPSVISTASNHWRSARTGRVSGLNPIAGPPRVRGFLICFRLVHVHNDAVVREPQITHVNEGQLRAPESVCLRDGHECGVPKFRRSQRLYMAD